MIRGLDNTEFFLINSLIYLVKVVLIIPKNVYFWLS